MINMDATTSNLLFLFNFATKVHVSRQRNSDGSKKETHRQTEMQLLSVRVNVFDCQPK